MNLQPAEPWADAFVRAVGTPLQYYRRTLSPPTYQKINSTMMVMLSGSTEKDGRRWIHASFSHPHRLPTWAELLEVKDAFIGRDRKAIQVLPPAAEYVNHHQYCLHLWACLDDDGIPDFRKEGPAGPMI